VLLQAEYLDILEEFKKESAEKRAKKNAAPPQGIINPPLPNMLQKSLMLPPDSARAMSITTKIARMMAIDYQPYSIVKDRGFREIITDLEPIPFRIRLQ